MLKSSDYYAELAEGECKTGGHPGKGLVYAKLAEVAVLKAQLQVDADRESRESFRDYGGRPNETARAIEKLAATLNPHRGPATQSQGWQA